MRWAHGVSSRVRRRMRYLKRMEHVAMHHGAATGLPTPLRRLPEPRPAPREGGPLSGAAAADGPSWGDAHPLMAPRRAWPQDADAIETHFERLSPADRNLRFCGAIGAASLHRHAQAAAAGSPLTLLALAPGGGWKARAVIEVAPMADDLAEVALSVEDPWRGSGVAAGLMRAAAGLCVRRGIGRMMALTLPENGAMQGLGLKLGGRLRRGPDGVEIHFDAADLLALTSVMPSPWHEPLTVGRPAFGLVPRRPHPAPADRAAA